MMISRGLVNSKIVAENIKTKNKSLKLLDASFDFLSIISSSTGGSNDRRLKPKNNKTPKENYLSERIVGAKYFDILGNFSDAKSAYSNTLPLISQFKQQIARLSIQPDDFVVAYDNDAIFSSPRCWWLFRMMGWKEDKVAVLNGGMSSFQAEYPDLIDSSPLDPSLIYDDTLHIEYPDLSFNEILIRDMKRMEKNIEEEEEEVVDARVEARFQGLVNEGANIAQGHIPGSFNIPFDQVLDQNNNFRSFKSENEIKEIFKKKGIDISDSKAKPIIATCGSGLTACSLLLALHSSGVQRHISLYDGSWTEYGDLRTGERPVEKGK